MMPNTVKKVGSGYKVVEKSTGKVVKNASGTPVSKHKQSKSQAIAQERAIYLSNKRRGKS